MWLDACGSFKVVLLKLCFSRDTITIQNKDVQQQQQQHPLSAYWSYVTLRCAVVLKSSDVLTGLWKHQISQLLLL
jgi:hypothetical protein